MIELDGRTGEGGGQLVRIAAALAAVTGQGLRISNVRGNRRGGGLKAQHVSAIQWLATATGATVEGLAVGSSTLVFAPGPSTAGVLGGHSSTDGHIVLRPATAAASTSLMLQAVLPYLVFRGGGEPVHVVLHGGTHVSWAPSYDYLDQVLFPTLESWFGLCIDRALDARGWSVGTDSFKDAGRVRLVVHPIGHQLTPSRQMLHRRADTAATITIDATILAPPEAHDLLTAALAHALDGPTAPALADADLHLRAVGDSGHHGRVYVLLVARTAESEAGPVRRWGHDYLGMENIRTRLDGGRGKTGKSGKSGKSEKSSSTDGGLSGLCERIAREVVQGLAEEVEGGGCGDSFLQDQVVVFQALASGRTSFWREDKEEAVRALGELQLNEDSNERSEDTKEDSNEDPFGQGSLHTQTARWVTAQMLAVQWFRGGTECEGAGWKGSKEQDE